ncbi:hypothetical protein G6011_05136 [Alternaria panax]|uniref:Uncharacterized protein n=1 Tax=Alternaria panax TaxID=48097 RepID=A0AAD4FD77_9PLEO|nr:hypothetical protein G6011_05136 [Alternaria panax]
MLKRQEAYDEFISGTKTPKISTRTSRGSEALARLRMRERLHQATPNTLDDFDEGDFDGHFTWERDGPAPLSNRYDEEHPVQDAELEDILAELDELCREERVSFLNADEDSDWDRYRVISAKLHADEPPIDTTILERIKTGEAPRDKVFEDLLVPLCTGPLVPGIQESEADMLETLLAWNKRIADECNDDLIARQAFITALVERVKVVDNIMAIVIDDTDSNQNNKTGQNGILEPSQRHLLKAIHAYRPETRSFRNQNPFDMLVIILAHVRQKEFEVANQDGCVYLIFKALNGQEQLKNRFNREKQRRSYQNQNEDAKQDDNRDEKLVTRIQRTRNELKKVGLDELLKLAVLRLAQPRAKREDDQDNHNPTCEEVLGMITQADDYDTLEDRLGKCFPDLEATLEVTAGKAQDMKTTHNLVLSRTVKFAGADLRGRNEDVRNRIMTARLNDPVTARIMEETLQGMLNTHLVATQMLVHLELMEESMSGLLEAATAKHDDLTGLACLINRDQRLGASNETDAEGVSAGKSEEEDGL